jgi:hypothetical protein
LAAALFTEQRRQRPRRIVDRSTVRENVSYLGINRHDVRAPSVPRGRNAADVPLPLPLWQDRYHATAVESGEHLARCVVYVDLNMVRAGVVAHPREWAAGGYHEIQGQRQRYRIVDRVALAQALEVDVGKLAEVHRGWVDEALRGPLTRRGEWSESVAVGG